MRTALAALAVAACVAASTPKLVYTRAFPGSVPDYFSVTIARSGALEYKEAPNDDQPLRAQLDESETAPLFELADKLEHFKAPLESGLKVANTGKKTFRYENESGVPTQVTFNYSLNQDAQALQTRFEQIASTEQAFLQLDHAVRYDKLGVNDALAQIESLWLHKQLVGRQQFYPLLTRIATHESFMHLVRERAARLKDEFSAMPASASAAPPQ